MGALLVVVSKDPSSPSLAAMAREIVLHPSETLDAWRDDEAGVVLYSTHWEGEPGVLVEPDVVLVADADMETARALIRGYRANGASCGEGLAGPFAFALWDRARRRLVIGTDVLSRHPLAYSQRGGVLAASTRALALLRHPQAPREWNAGYLVHVLGDIGAQAPGDTAFAGVKRVLPGCAGVYEEGRLSLRRVDALQPRPSAKGAAHDAFWAALEESTRRYDRACISLSGGLDSACVAVARLRARREGPLAAFSFVSSQFPELDERPRIEAILFARTRGFEPHFIEALPSRPDVLEGPLPDDPCVLAPGFEAARRALVAAAAGEGHRVLLDGEGGDELFDSRGRLA